ncbi:MAG TPA: glycosyltransferase family 39 protein [Pirellulales bacterium]|nr:glycosyltransferase family 39 protein [Pirellulales bacterium]
MPTDRPQPAWRARYGILIAALLLSVACQLYICAQSPIISKDGVGFIHIAKSLAVAPAMTMRTYDQHPGYPALVLACERAYRRFSDDDEFQSFIAGTRLASGICGVFAVAFLWLFARRLYDERIANVSVLLMAVWPLFRLNASDSLSDTPHLMLFLAGTWLACEGLTSRGRRVGWFAAAGVASGLAFWVRPEGLVVAAATAVALFVAACWQFLFKQRRQDRTAGLAAPDEPSRAADEPPRLAFYAGSLVALIVATGMVVAPYVVVAGKITSKKLPFGQPPPSAHEVAMETIEPTPGLLSEPRPGGTLPDEFGRPSRFIGVVALGLIELGREMAQGFYYLALIPLAFGTFAPSRPQPAPRLTLIHILLMNGHAALLMLLYLRAGYISHRHVIPLVALMLPTAAAGTVWLAELASRRLTLAGSPRRALAIATGLFYLGLVPKCLTPLQAAYLPVFQAAQRVKAEAKPGDCVLSTSGYVRFYTDLPGILVGSEAPNLPIALYFAPDKIWSFIVLEIDDRSFDRQFLIGSQGDYDEVMELPAHPRKPWAKVVVFRARAGARKAASQLARVPAQDPAPPAQ